MAPTTFKNNPEHSKSEHFSFIWFLLANFDKCTASYRLQAASFNKCPTPYSC